MLLHSLFPLLLAAKLVSLGDIYVDQAAVNCTTGTGTAANPVCTIPEAIALASPGDTVLIAPGIYLGNLVLPFDLELTGTDGQTVTILDGQDTASVVAIPAGVNGTLEGLTLRNGKGIPRGGGILVEGNLVIRNSTITENRTVGANGPFGGGGIAALAGGSTVVIEQCSIVDNFSDNRGGGIAIDDGVLMIRDSRISDNTTWSLHFPGGGVFSTSSLLQITNTTISGNRAQAGGGVAAWNSLTGSEIRSCTVTQNLGYPGGISSSVMGALSLTNSIVAGNFSENPGFLYYTDIRYPFSSTSNNLVGIAPVASSVVDGVNGNLVGTVAAPLDPGLGALQRNGGSTLTYALLAGSPAIDAGDPLNFPPFDQRGIPRPFGLAPDIGAFERPYAGTELCSGDGGDQLGCTDCPCGNNAPAGTVGGCLNRTGNSARLSASGSHSVSLPPMALNDLRFGLTGAPPRTLCVLRSAQTLAPVASANPCSGLGSGAQALAFDGLRCAVFFLRLHGSRVSDVNGAIGVTNDPWGGEGPPNVGIARFSGGFSPGQARYFQVLYREDPTAVCLRGLNTSQAIEVVFSP